ncbi:MAG: DNA replication and repair protein RecF [Patescibacteria group bacterium]
MILQKIVLHNFRNRDSQIFELSTDLTVFLGENAKGKTNLLESVFFLINGQGFREVKEEELIRIGEIDCRVEGRFDIQDRHLDFKIYLKKINGAVEKTYFVDRAKKKHFQYKENQTKAILFAPEHIEIITGPPDMRRTYFNKIISYYDVEYKKRLVNLESALRRRNKVLEHGKSDTQLREELGFWDTYITKQASYITGKREEYINYLNKHSKLDHKAFYINYLKNEATLSRFTEMFEEEKRWRRTLIGPQKDEFQIIVTNDMDKNIHHYGSRSEQRLAVFWLKLNEITYHEDLYHKKPILLLDDIFSEFDRNNKKLIIGLIKKYQTILTTTEKEVMDLINIPKKVIKV